MSLLARTPVRALLTRLRETFPTAYWRGRNGVALLKWSVLRLRSRWREPADPYDRRFWEARNTGDSDGFARALLAAFPTTSVVDVGCGRGQLLAAIHRIDPTIALLGLDDSPMALEGARTIGIPMSRVDVTRLSRAELNALRAEVGRFDLALCLEVAEHMPSWHAGTLLELLTGAPRIVFSAARPNQGGRLHVNEQPAAYWIRRFQQLGFELSPSNEAFRAAIAGLEIPWWYKANINVYQKA